MRRALAVLALVLLAACGPPAAGPEPAVGRVSLLDVQPPPVYALLGYRERLNLSSPQVVSLDSIGRAAQSQNDSLVARLQDLASRRRGGFGRGRDAMPEEAAPVIEQIRANNRQVAEAVREVLTPAQQQTTCELFDESRERSRERREPRSRREMPRDSVHPGAGRVWFWCTGETAL